jgi:hypothetical protein
MAIVCASQIIDSNIITENKSVDGPNSNLLVNKSNVENNLSSELFVTALQADKVLLTELEIGISRDEFEQAAQPILRQVGS